MLTLEDLARGRLADRLRQAEHQAWLARARRDAAAANATHDTAAAEAAHAAQVTRPARAPQLLRLQHALAAALRLLASRLDGSVIVTSTRTESVPIQSHSRR